VITDHFSGPGRAISPVCLCAQATTFELNDFRRRSFARWFNLTLYVSSLKVKVIGHKMKNVPFRLRIHVDVFFLVACGVLCEVIGATSSEDVLVHTVRAQFTLSRQNRTELD